MKFDYAIFKKEKETIGKCFFMSKSRKLFGLLIERGGMYPDKNSDKWNVFRTSFSIINYSSFSIYSDSEKKGIELKRINLNVGGSVSDSHFIGKIEVILFNHSPKAFEVNVGD